MSEQSRVQEVNFDALLSIGQIIVKLRDEFPDISISKIRFLETNGLVTPARTPSGYRKFSLIDLERLRYILRVQRDHFLPLKVIRDHIDAMDRGLEPPALTNLTPTPPKNLLSTDSLTSSGQETAVQLTADELCQHAGLTGELLAEMISYNLVKADSRGLYSAGALKIARQVALLNSFGLEPRHLKTVVSAASREVDLFTPIVKSAKSGKNPASKAEVDEISLNLANAILALHEHLVRELLDSLH